LGPRVYPAELFVESFVGVIYKGKRLLHAALCANETDIICVCVRERERARAREKERNSERESERASERENVNACEIGLYVCV